MIYRKIGNTNINASVIAFGAFAIGGGPWWGKTEDKQSIDAIHTAFDCGINFIDTAPLYGYGRSEEVIGKAIAGNRDKYVISSKCGLWWKDDRGSYSFENDGVKVYKSLQPETIRIEIEDSLRRLNTDYIDLYHTHWQSLPPCYTPISETMECLLKLKEQGKIRAIAVSNCDVEQMKEYSKVGIINANQNHYNMLDRGIEGEFVDYCVKNNISILAYAPLVVGLLTGKFTMNDNFDNDSFRSGLYWFKTENRKRVIDMLNSWSDLTEKHNCTIAQLVLSWTFSQKGITCLLCGARKPEQVLENVKAIDVKLSPEELMRMRNDAEKLGCEPF